MAITANFRPAQHVYQSTYEPFPFQEIAPIAMRMQQEYTQGIGALAETQSFVEGLPVAKADTEIAPEKLDTVRNNLDSVLQETPDARSPEFHLKLNKVVSDIKKDPFWKVTAHNAKREAEWEKTLQDQNIPAANRWRLMKEYAKYQEEGSAGYGQLGEASVPEYIDYQKRLDDLADDFLPEGWKQSLATDEYTKSGGSKGVDPRRVANVLGLNIKDNKLVLGTGIPNWFYQGEAGNQLRMEAEYIYDNIKANNPDDPTTLQEVEDSLYYDTASKLIEKHSGFVTESGQGVVAKGGSGDDYEGLDFFSYLTELSSLKGTTQAKQALNSYKKSNAVALWGKFANKAGFNLTTNMVNDFIEDIRNSGYSDEEIRQRLDVFKFSLANTLGNIPVAGTVPMGSGVGLVIANGITAPIEYSMQENAPSMNSLTPSQLNTMFRVMDELNYSEEEKAQGITDEVWKKMQKNTLKFYEQGIFVDVGLSISDESKAVKHIKDTTERLFGIGSNSGEVTVGTNGAVPGMLSQLVIIDAETGEHGKIQDLDLPTGEKIPVQYKGTLDPRNPYGPQTLAIHINGKDYYALGQNPTMSAIDASNLNSYRYSYDGHGVEFNTGFSDPNTDQPITAKPVYNYNTKQYELHFNDGNVYRSDESMEDAYLQYLDPNYKPGYNIKTSE